MDFPEGFCMRADVPRTVFTVARHDGGWAVEKDGEFFDQTTDKEEAKASAHKRARAAQATGELCQVRISGEHGFFG
jgi:hypothetical protein